MRPFPALFAATALLGAGTIVAAAERAWLQKTKRAAVIFAVMLAPISFRAVRFAMLSLTPGLMPQTQDALLYVFDASYGAQVSFAAGQLFREFPALASLAFRSYIAMPLAIASLYAIWFSREHRSRPQVNIVVMAIAMSLAGYVAYFAVPACGPAYQFGAAFPGDAPDAALLSGAPVPLTIPGAPRNCLPSLHLAWALMVLLNTRRLSLPIKAGAAAFFALTALATLGLGEHYLVDLVVAVPFTVGFQAMCNRLVPALDGARLLCAGWGVAATAGWMIFLRLGTPLYRDNYGLSWTLSVLTVTVSLVLEWRLARRSLAPAAVQSATARATPIGLLAPTRGS
ncbi:MAG TPA: phosphatase PAP2 family protein [Bryobacteraceae bacterium]|nr:phosphatase PAP2 family protein [Bryobacteraceae bacterium]